MFKKPLGQKKLTLTKTPSYKFTIKLHLCSQISPVLIKFATFALTSGFGLWALAQEQKAKARVKSIVFHMLSKS
jgi:hypothetical protein